MCSVLVRRTPLAFRLVLAMILLLGALNALPTTAVADPQQTSGTVIAYVSSSTNSQAIRLVNPDGTGDRPLWRLPVTTSPQDAIGTLAWRPDGGEILFDSGHDWERSMAIRDLYAIGASGSPLRRISSPPGPAGYGNYPTGTVTFEVDALESGDAQVYIQGALEPVKYVAKTAYSYRITQTVADLGDGARQYIRLWDPDALDYPCMYSEEAWVDVVAGQTTDLGTIYFSSATSDQACWRMFSPSWSHDGSRILYLFREPTPFAYPVNTIWQTTPRAGVNLLGEQLLDVNEFSTPGRFYRVAFGPTAARSNDVIILQNEALYDLLYYATTTDLANRRQLDIGGCPRLECDLLDVVWLPDGSGLLIARYERGYSGTPAPAEGGALYYYDFADGSLREILRLHDELIGKLTIAPDGSAIVFERGQALVERVERNLWGPSLQCPCSLWRVNSDGSELRQLVADGRAPAWSTRAPSVEPAPNPNLSQRLWLPLLR